VHRLVIAEQLEADERRRPLIGSSGDPAIEARAVTNSSRLRSVSVASCRR